MALSALRSIIGNKSDQFAQSPYKLSDNKRLLTATPFSAGKNAYGCISIKSKKNQLHLWKFKVINKIGYMYIGISRSHKVFDTPFVYTGYGYGLRCDGERYSANGNKNMQYKIGNAYISYKQDDIISMQLNLETRILSFSVNNGDTIEFDHIIVSDAIHYTLAICLQEDSDSIKLLEYNTYEIVKQKQRKRSMSIGRIMIKNMNKNLNVNDECDKKYQHKFEYRKKLDEATQANAKLIDEISKLKQDFEEKKQEFKNKKTVNKQVNLDEILQDLKNGFEAFESDYNKSTLKHIYKTSPQQLITKESVLNETIKHYNVRIGDIMKVSKVFSEYIMNIQLYINKISVPNIREYKLWNLEQIMVWIISLEDGKYIPFAERIRNGFVESKILSGDLLPELTRSDLSNPPFNIKEFVVKRDLEKHFKSLLNGNILEGSTVYI